MRNRKLPGSFKEDFEPVALSFEPDIYRDIFGKKNNKSLGDTLAHPRYAKLSAHVDGEFSGRLLEPLGAFLLSLKHAGNEFYRKFLNKYGDLEYSTFRIDDHSRLVQKGVYAYFVGEELVYIGRCRDSMKKRINQGYGKINPKNCYIDGQATNCHLNARITQEPTKPTLWLHPLDSEELIVRTESELISALKPRWNIQLR